MNVLEKLFNKLQKHQTPDDLKARIMSIKQQERVVDNTPAIKPTFERKSFALLSVLKPVLAIVLLVTLLGGAYWQFFRLPHLAAAFELVPEQGDTAGVPQNGAFIIKSSKFLTSFQLKQAVHFEPEVDFSVDSLGGNTFRVKPKGGLERDTVYSIKIDEGIADRDYSWAYQIKAPFQVLGTTPSDKTSYVPTNTGIQINFNREGFLDPEEYFEISPKVGGKFEQYGNLLTFVPKEVLKTQTVYTVRVKKGLAIKNSEDVLTDDKVFQFETDNGAGGGWSEFWVNPDFREYAVGNVSFQVFTNPEVEKEAKLKIYKFETGDAFINSYKNSRNWEYSWTYFTQRNQRADLAGAGGKLMSEVTVPFKNQDWYSYIELPEKFSNGFYAVEAGGSSEFARAQVWFQVTPYSHYASLSKDNSLVWLMDFIKKQPIKNASVSVVGGELLGETSSEGLLNFKTPESFKQSVEYTSRYNYSINGPSLLKVEAGTNQPYYMFVSDNSGYGSPYYGGDPYWHHLSTDRPIYQMTDSVKFFGAVKERANGKLGGKTLVAALTNEGYYYQSGGGEVSDDYKPLKSVSVEVSASGIYEGEIMFEGLTPGYYSINILDGKKIVDYATIHVLSYSKPAYKLSVNPKQNSYFVGDAIIVNVTAEFFDGTPVANMELEYIGNWDKEIKGTFRTDAKGSGQIRLSLPYYEENNMYSYWPKSFYLSVVPLREEEGFISGSTSVTIYGPKISLNASSVVEEDGTNIFTAQVDRIEPKERVAASYTYFDYESHPQAGQIVNADLVKTTVVKVQTGEYFDYLTNTVSPQYRYDNVEEIIDRLEGLTNGEGKWSFKKKIEYKDDVYYTVKFRAVDSTKITVKSSVGYTHRSPEYVPITTPPLPNVEIKNERLEPVINFKSPKFETNENQNLVFSENDEYSVELSFYNSETVSKDSNRLVLFYGYQTNIIGAKVSKDTVYKDSFKDVYKPSVSYRAVVLGPKGFEEAYAITAMYKLEDAEINIESHSDKDKYRPGEKATIEVKLTDNNKNPVSADVNLSVVDEAVFAIEEAYNSNILQNLYRWNIVEPITDYTQYENALDDGGGKGGGGGDESVRNDFKDTAYFGTLHIGNSGSGEFTFTMPDSITSYRTTLLAVDMEKLKAGYQKSSVVSTLPFFVDVTVSNTYLEGDEPSVRVRLFGEEYKENNKSTITVESKELGVSVTKDTIDGLLYAPLPKLKTGRFVIRATGLQNGRKDVVEKTFEVFPSYFKTPVVKETDINDGQVALDLPNNGLVQATFIEKGRGQYYNDLVGLSYTYGMRIEAVASRYYASQTMVEVFGDTLSSSDLDLTQYARQDGLSIVTYGDADLQASALVTTLLPDKVPSSRLIGYFNQALIDEAADTKRISQALLGLAALKQPVLSKVQAFAKEPSLSQEDKLYVASALALFGDKEGARKIYIEGVRAQFKEDAGVLSLPHGESSRQLRNTTHAAWLAAELKEESDFQKLWKYTQGNWPEKEPNWIEKALALRTRLGTGKVQPVTFTFQTKDNKKEVKLEKGYGQSFDFFADELKTISFSNLKGEAVMITRASKAVDFSTLNKNSQLNIKREFLVNGQEASEMKVGDVVKIKLSITRSGDSKEWGYEVTDYLPSGLRLLTPQYSIYDYNYDPCTQEYWYPNLVEGNEVSFTTYRSDDRCKDQIMPITYSARVVSTGTFRADPASVAPVEEPTNMNISGSQILIIKP